LPHARDISPADWSATATALGKLHSEPVPAWPGLETLPSPQSGAVETAATFWAQRGQREVAQRAAELILRGPPSESPSRAAPLVEHGDCHTENIVRDEDGTFRWIDWQEAHLGDGFSDLAFLWQRAEFAGGSPPRAAMTAAYAAARQLPSLTDIDRELKAAELRLLFLSWPPFLGYGRPEEQHLMMRRLATLVDALD
jgi:aminoglycoside phosphotransferase (APT) family kinase protein